MEREERRKKWRECVWRKESKVLIIIIWDQVGREDNSFLYRWTVEMKRSNQIV